MVHRVEVAAGAGVAHEVGAAEVLHHERRRVLADAQIGEPGAVGVLAVGLTRVSSSGWRSRAAETIRGRQKGDTGVNSA